MSEHKSNILKLRSQGKSYKQIKKLLGCSSGTIAYHLGSGQKAKNVERQQKRRSSQHPFVKKVEAFKLTIKKNPRKPVCSVNKLLYEKVTRFHHATGEKKNVMNNTFTAQDVIDKFGETPKCYLTGEDIDINKPRTYHFDHIVPRTRGGSNTLDNLGLCTKDANQAKYNMTRDEFIEFCKKVLLHNGYNVTK